MTSLRQKPVGRIAPLTWTTDPEEHRRLLAEATDGLRVRVTGLESARVRVTVASTTYTAADEGIILVDDTAAGGAVAISLLTAANRINPYRIKKIGNTANVTITPAGSETIDGAANLVLTTQYQSVDLEPDNSQWWTF